MQLVQALSKTGTTSRTGLFSLRRNKSVLLLALLLTFSSLNLTPASASRGGTEVRGNTFSIGYTFSLGGIDQVCSGALLSGTILVTAAHCVMDSKGNKSSGYIFAPPGTAMDAPINPSIA